MTSPRPIPSKGMNIRKISSADGFGGLLSSDSEKARIASYSLDENGEPIDPEILRQWKADERLRVKTKILCGRSHTELSNLIATKIGIPLTRVKTTDFGNTEIGIEITESVRGFHVFIIQTGGPYEGRNKMNYCVFFFCVFFWVLFFCVFETPFTD